MHVLVVTGVNAAPLLALTVAAACHSLSTALQLSQSRGASSAAANEI